MLTSDRDMSDGRAYENVPIDSWTKRFGASVCYLSPRNRRIWKLAQLVREDDSDCVYLNGLFEADTIGLLAWHRLGFFSGKRVIVAPHGVLDPGALRYKRHKKRMFLSLARMVGLGKGTVWHATTEQEAAAVRRYFGPIGNVRVVPVLGAIPDQCALESHRPKRSGELRLAFYSRISPKKNLPGALEILKHVRVRVDFDVYGTIESKLHWRTCVEKEKELPGNVRMRYHGELSPEDVGRKLSKYDLFFLPTFGENFGQVISEALAAATPVLISDKTPWTGLTQAKAGWAFPLSNREAFVRELEAVAEMDEKDHISWRKGAVRFAKARSADPDTLRSYMELFSG